MKSQLFFYIFLCIILVSPSAFSQYFTKITQGELVNDESNSVGVAWVDFDNNGFMDIFIVNGGGHSDENNFLYRNIGDGIFIPISEGETVTDLGHSFSCTWGDYNNDGFIDLFVANDYDDNCLYKNIGDYVFIKITQGQIVNDGGRSVSCSWGDYNNDGFLDLFVANLDQPNFLYKNNGNETFTKITEGNIVNDVGNSGTPTWVDYDNDSDLDLFVTNYWNQKNYLYQNNGEGTFTKITTGILVEDEENCVSCSWGDYDNDGDFDVFIANGGWRYNEDNSLYQNNGDGTFTKIMEDIVSMDGGKSTSSTWFDFDNDGYLDLFVSNSSNSNNFLYKNNQNGTFTKVQEEDIVNDADKSYGIGACDYDGDGDVDLFVCNDWGQNNCLYQNNESDNNWINIKCVGTSSNISAIGAKVIIQSVSNDEILWQQRQISSQTGKSAQNSLNAIFGLGDASIVEMVMIEWPSGTTQIMDSVAVNQFLTITEPETKIKSQNAIDLSKKSNLNQNYPNPFNPTTTIAFTIPQDGSHLQGGLHLRLNIYDISGKLIKTLVDSPIEPGYHSVVWNGKDDAGHDVASGVYFYRIEAGGSYSETKSMLLLK